MNLLRATAHWAGTCGASETTRTGGRATKAARSRRRAASETTRSRRRTSETGAGRRTANSTICRRAEPIAANPGRGASRRRRTGRGSNPRATCATSSADGIADIFLRIVDNLPLVVDGLFPIRQHGLFLERDCDPYDWRTGCRAAKSSSGHSRNTRRPGNPTRSAGYTSCAIAAADASADALTAKTPRPESAGRAGRGV